MCMKIFGLLDGTPSSNLSLGSLGTLKDVERIQCSRSTLVNVPRSFSGESLFLPSEDIDTLQGAAKRAIDNS